MNERELDKDIITDKTIKAVKKYLYLNNADCLVISSTTGYTADKFIKANVFSPKKCIICTQKLSESVYMSEDTKKNLEDIGVRFVDIPNKYLTNCIGLKSVNILRSIAQGVKVCVELIEYLCEQSIVNEMDTILVVAGTVQGADTIVEAIIKKKNYKIKIVRVP